MTRQQRPWMMWIAILALLAGLGIGGVTLVASMGVWFGLWDFRRGFALLQFANAYAGWIAIAGLIITIGLLALSQLWKIGNASKLVSLALIGTAAAGLGYYVPEAYRPSEGANIPPIHDVSTDTVDPPAYDTMNEPPRNPKKGIFTKRIISLITIGGLASTMINLSLFIWASHSGRSAEEAMTMVFVSLVLIQFFKAYSFRSDHHHITHRIGANKWLNLAVGWELCLLLLIIYVPFLQKMFKTFALTAGDWAIVIVAAFLIIPIIEIAKMIGKNHPIKAIHTR